MINPSTPIIPQATSADLHGISALLAFLADKDACAKRLADLTEATKKHDEARAAAVAERAGVETQIKAHGAAEAKVRATAEAARKEAEVAAARLAARAAEIDKYQETVKGREAVLAERECVAGELEKS